MDTYGHLFPGEEVGTIDALPDYGDRQHIRQQSGREAVRCGAMPCEHKSSGKARDDKRKPR